MPYSLAMEARFEKALPGSADTTCGGEITGMVQVDEDGSTQGLSIEAPLTPGKSSTAKLPPVPAPTSVQFGSGFCRRTFCGGEPSGGSAAAPAVYAANHCCKPGV